MGLLDLGFRVLWFTAQVQDLVYVLKCSDIVAIGRQHLCLLHGFDSGRCSFACRTVGDSDPGLRHRSDLGILDRIGSGLLVMGWNEDIIIEVHS